MNVLFGALSRIPIKTPQLIGILCGITVFTVTIAVVIYLLIWSGTLQGALREMQGVSADGSSSLFSGNKSPSYHRPPGLHDHLILAAKTLPLSPSVADLMQCTGVNVLPFDADTHSKELCTASDGTALFHESAYDAFERLWQWIYLAPTVMTYTEPQAAPVSALASLYWADQARPHISETSFKAWYGRAPADARHLCIADGQLARLVGMLSLACNRPYDLSIEICNVWVTPAFRTSSTIAGGAPRPPHAQIAVYLTLCSLFDASYRRVTMNVATANIAGRKFADACGFQVEGIHRKHRIAFGANQDTCAYALLNSDWPAVKTAWERRLGMKPIDVAADADSHASGPAASAASAAASAAATGARFAASAAPTLTAAAADAPGMHKRPKTHIFDKCLDLDLDSHPTWTDVQPCRLSKE